MSSLLDARRLEDERVELSSRRSGVMEALEEVQQKFEACKVNHFHDEPLFELLNNSDVYDCRLLTLEGDGRRRLIFSSRPSKSKKCVFLVCALMFFKTFLIAHCCWIFDWTLVDCCLKIIY
jgi:hypothetical protein